MTLQEFDQAVREWLSEPAVLWGICGVVLLWFVFGAFRRWLRRRQGRRVHREFEARNTRAWRGHRRERKVTKLRRK